MESCSLAVPTGHRTWSERPERRTDWNADRESLGPQKPPVLTELGKCFSEQSLLSIYRPALQPLGQQNLCVTQWVPSPKPESKLLWVSLAGEKEETISDKSSMGIYSSKFERSWGWISVKTSDLRASATRLGSLQRSVKM